jgi:hypothetical protein
MHNVLIELSLKKISYISVNPDEDIYNWVPKSLHKIYHTKFSILNFLGTV